MELIATDSGGETVACAYGCVPEGRSLRAGMLFVQAGLPARELTFTDPTTSETLVLLLPENAVGLPGAARAYLALLEAP